MINNSLKEYYVKLHTLYNNAINILTAINQSLSTNASEVSIELFENNTSSTVKIPSFLYLDNKLEQLENSFSNLFNMPQTGEAWFSNDGSMYKLQLVRSNTAPLSPAINKSKLVAGFSNNEFIKDLVNPRTYIRLNIDNLPFNIEQMYMKKMVFLNTALYSELSKLNVVTYEDYVAALFNYRKGIDYDEYDSVIDLPIKRDKFVSEFKIDAVIDKDDISDKNNNIIYTLKLNTLEYHNAEDSSEVYYLKPGDYLCIGNELCIYKVTDVDYTLMNITVIEHIGHVPVQSYNENSDMILQKYNYNYSEYNYVDVPLEENQFIAIFIGTIYNGVRSNYSEGILLDLGSIYMINEDGSYMKDIKGNFITYIEYYNQYCNNIGDLILGLTQSAYPQISNYNAYQLKQLQDGEEIVKYVSGTVNTEGTLVVLPINSHIYDDTTISTIKNYHAQKASIQSSLNTLTENISTTNNTLLTTDWSQETELSQSALQSQLQTYYNERLTLEKQLNAIVNDINILSGDNNTHSSTKYRIRGVTNTQELDLYIKSITNNKVHIIGLEVEYKYKSVSKQTTTLTSIEKNIFTDWNRLTNIDKQRKLIFDETTNGYTVEFVNYDSLVNIIKWNQIDIPINANEDVIVRVRYKYNIGQPFINIYSPWSDEITISFPTEYTDNVEIAQIVSTNENDVISSKFSSKLINDGYEEHITNKLIASNQTFFHMPENIYSGFNTAENNLISLKDKLTQMCNDISVYKDLIQTESQKRFQVYLQYDGKNIEMHPNNTNRISLYNIEHISDYYIKKDMNIVIKNTGEVDINLYSIFPGNIDVPLLHTNIDKYKDTENYQQYPIFINGAIDTQRLGQWIYFRQINPYTKETILYNENNTQKTLDSRTTQDKTLNISNPQDIFGTNNKQLGLVNKLTDSIYSNRQLLHISRNNGEVLSPEETISNVKHDYLYTDTNYASTSVPENKILYKYSDIYYIGKDSSKKYYLDNETAISTFASKLSAHPQLGESKNYDGAFLYVNLENISQILTEGGERDNKVIPVGESVSIPIVFEYYLSVKEKISKRIMFDLRNSLVTNPLNYIVEITANYDNSLHAEMYDNTEAAIVDDASI
jgi:hypothetical protein